MKTIAKIDLKAEGSGKKRLIDTMEAFNAACDDIAATCFKQKSASKFLIQKIVYHDIREKHGLSAQLVIRAISKTCEAYKRDKSIQPKFKKHGSITYDARILTFKGLGTDFPQVSLTTLEGRTTYEVAVRAYFASRTDRINGQVDLVYRDGKFFLYATCDMPEDTPIEPEDVLGIDLGVINICVDSTGETFSNQKVELNRVRIHKHRAKLQRKNTKSSKRKLKKVSGKEARFRTNTNHCISKHLVEKAKDTCSGIALEELTHIQSRTTVRRNQRAERMSWSFFQLRSFLTYKAKLAGIPVYIVDPRNTSRQCSTCGYIDKMNRKTQSKFLCVSCGHHENADVNASKNIRTRGVSTALLSSATDLLKVG
jgi:putative transposase